MVQFFRFAKLYARATGELNIEQKTVGRCGCCKLSAQNLAQTSNAFYYDTVPNVLKWFLIITVLNNYLNNIIIFKKF